jgi:hypothetical protein
VSIDCKYQINPLAMKNKWKFDLSNRFARSQSENM